MSVPTVLENILARKVQEVAERSARVSPGGAGKSGQGRPMHPVVSPRH